MNMFNFFSVNNIKEFNLATQSCVPTFVYSSSLSYFKYLNVSLTSVLWAFSNYVNNNDVEFQNKQINFIIFNDCSIRQKDLEFVSNFFNKMHTNIDVTLYIINLEMSDFAITDMGRKNWNLNSFNRIFTFHKTFNNLDNLVFIDPDTIVSNDLFYNLESHIDLLNESGMKIAAALDLGISNFCDKCISEEAQFFDEKVSSFFGNNSRVSFELFWKEYLKIDPHDYFNVGFFIVNNKTNKKNYFDELFKLCKTEKYPIVDQDCMNRILYKNVYFLPIEYNFPPNFNIDEITKYLLDTFKMDKKSLEKRILNAKKKSYVYHFYYGAKPWTARRIFLKDKTGYKLFLEWAVNSPYKREIKKILWKKRIIGNWKLLLKFTARIFERISFVFKHFAFVKSD